VQGIGPAIMSALAMLPGGSAALGLLGISPGRDAGARGTRPGSAGGSYVINGGTQIINGAPPGAADRAARQGPPMPRAPRYTPAAGY
jgi:hypothetical protein